MASTTSTHFDLGEYAYLTGIPNRDTALTYCFWVRTPSTARGNRGVCGVYSSSNTAYRDQLRNREWLNTTELTTIIEDLGSDVRSYTPLVLGTWYFMAFAYSAGTIRFYRMVEGSGMVEHRNDAVFTWGAVVGDTIEIGRNTPVGLQTYEGSFQHLRIWGAALSQAQLEQEAAYDAPVTTGDLWSWYTLVDGSTADQSGNSRDLTVLGTLSSGVLGPDLASVPTASVNNTIMFGANF